MDWADKLTKLNQEKKEVTIFLKSGGQEKVTIVDAGLTDKIATFENVGDSDNHLHVPYDEIARIRFST